MKRIEQGVLLAGLLAFMLAGCSSTGDVERANSSLSSEIDSSIPAAASTPATPAMPATGATGTSASGSMASGDSGQTSGSAPSSASIAPNSTVTSIEVVQRPAGASGAGTVAGAAVGGATGATSGDRVYRITLRMDDGQTQVVTQEWAPTFSTGDRVRISGSGAIQR
jgi:outer membrane lipoprotein SlyB